MEYKNTVKGIFKSRPNRFIANVLIDGKLTTVHVKNTGRCKELLLPDVSVILEKSDNPERKTQYDLICVYKENLGWINIDSQAPNKVMAEWLGTKEYSLVKPEYTFGNSRIDFYMEQGNDKYLMEVKGCTLEIDGVGYFPDAPTQRGVKHIYELISALDKGYKSILAFVIPMENISKVLPNMDTHPEFGYALNEAINAGVSVWYMKCAVTENTLKIVECIQADSLN